MLSGCFLDHCTFKNQRTGRSHYGFHAYNEVCQFVYCLLTRSRKLSSLPELSDWESYIDLSKVVKLEKVAINEFLLNDDFSVELSQSTNSEVCDFRNRCREFVDHLVNVLLAQHVLYADFFYGIHCFCPELLLEGMTSVSFNCSPGWSVSLKRPVVSRLIVLNLVWRNLQHLLWLFEDDTSSQS